MEIKNDEMREVENKLYFKGWNARNGKKQGKTGKLKMKNYVRGT